jgi:serine/threonine-protein kinase
MHFASLEDEVKYLRALVRVTRLADDILEDCLDRQMGLAAALDVFLSHAVRLVHASAGFVEVRGSRGPVISRVVGRPGVQVETAMEWSGPVALIDGRTLFVKPLTLGKTRIGSLGVTLAGHFEDRGEQVMSLVDAMGELLDTSILAFLAISEGRSPLQRLEELSEARAFQPHARVGNYELVGPLGTGGMAQVMVARAIGPQGLGRLVAIKRILPHLCADENIVRQFLEEARIGLRLSHPNLVTIYDFGEAGGGYYIAMELVRGVDFDDLIHSKAAPLHLRVVAGVMCQALAGLHAAHEIRGQDGSPMNLVHRDLSPHNLMVGFDGRVKILDFGVAKAKAQMSVTLPGLVKGKPLYMSPEQATASALDRRSDLFSMGLILYEAITGKRPFARDNDAATMNALVRDPAPYDEKIPAPIWELLQRALAKEPSDRFADANEMLEALRKRVDPVGEVDLGKLIAVHFPDRLRAVSQWERLSQPDSKIHEETTKVRAAVQGK